MSSGQADFSTYVPTLLSSTGIKNISVQYDSTVVDELLLKHMLLQLKKGIKLFGMTGGLQQRSRDNDCNKNRCHFEFRNL